MNVAGKKVLITGGSRGIGAAIARLFADHGAYVTINYKSNAEAAQQTIQSLSQGPHHSIQTDITDADAIPGLIDKAADLMSGLDIVVNNAGIFVYHPLAEIDYRQWQETWKKTLSVNLDSAANICYCAARYMMKQGGGRIVNVSSRGAFRGEPEAPAYGASKAGLNAMSQSLAQALAPHNIFVGVVAPGFVETDMAKEILEGPMGDDIRNQSPLGRVAKPGEVAQAVLFLASGGTEFMTGAIIDVNGASYLRS
jgi:NAD(P)-dependent dehydrogenase (short-subunit alcohol dehydrogenase family)